MMEDSTTSPRGIEGESLILTPFRIVSDADVDCMPWTSPDWPYSAS